MSTTTKKAPARKKPAAKKKKAPRKAKAKRKAPAKAGTKRTAKVKAAAPAKVERRGAKKRILPGEERDYPVQLRFTKAEHEYIATKCKDGQAVTGFLTELCLSAIPDKHRRSS